MVSTISCQEFAPLSKKGGFDLIDVRTPMEFYEVHAVGSLNVPLDTLNPERIMASRGAHCSRAAVCYLPIRRTFRSGVQGLRQSGL